MTAQRVVITKVERFHYHAPEQAYPLRRIDADNDGAATSMSFDATALGMADGSTTVRIMLNTPKEVDALIDGLNALRAWQTEQTINEARRES